MLLQDFLITMLIEATLNSIHHARSMYTHIITEPPPCLTIRITVRFESSQGSRTQHQTLPSEENLLILVSSENIM